MSFLGVSMPSGPGYNDYGGDISSSYISGGQNAADSAAKINPETYSNVQSIQGLAKQYRQNLPQYEGAYDSALQEQASNQAQLGDQQLKSSAANRGLLYSGLLEGAQQQNRSNIAQALMNRRSQANMQFENTAFGLDQEAAASGLGLASMEQQIANQKYNAQFETSKQNQGQLPGLISGFGGG